MAFPLRHRKWHDHVVRVLVCDEFSLFRRQVVVALERESDIEIVGEGPDTDVAMTVASQVAPDVVVLGTNLPTRGGVATAETLRELLPRAGLALAVDLDDERDHHQLLRAVRVGITAFFGRHAVAETAAETVRSSALGRPVIDASVAGIVLAEFERVRTQIGRPVPPTLDPIEGSVLDAIATGRSVNEAAAHLGLGRVTAANAVANALAKLQRFSRLDARARATRGAAPGS